MRLSIFVLAATLCATAATPPADLAYRHGHIYTVDANDSVRQALAVRDGRIVYVGSDRGAAAFIGPKTQVIDLRGRMMMPGLVDGHMHPIQGGTQQLHCNLHYASLTVAQFRERIQACLDAAGPGKEPDAWLRVESWFREDMTPKNAVVDRATLDSLKTKRPIIVVSSFGHTALANSRALAMAGINRQTVAPAGGQIARDAAEEASGILEDNAIGLVLNTLPKLTAAEELAGARAALEAMRKQGVTSFFHAGTRTSWIEPFARLAREGALTARAHFAPLISPDEGADPAKAVAAVAAMAARFHQPETRPQPGIKVRHAKMLLDGVITAPTLTGSMLAPYWENKGTAAQPRWLPGENRGPDVYFPAATLRALLEGLANVQLDPHMHADGDRAVREALDGIEFLRQKFPGRDIRGAIAHVEVIDKTDVPRFKQLNAIPVLSFQWQKPAPDTIEGARDTLGPDRFRYLEPAGLLATAGARIAFGSDWPVDPLDQWFALKVGVTRTSAPQAAKQYKGRLGVDPGLSRQQVIRAITMNASFQLRQENDAGSLEVGKLADLVVIDRNFFQIPAEDIANIKVLQTVVGGKTVYQAAGF